MKVAGLCGLILVILVLPIASSQASPQGGSIDGIIGEWGPGGDGVARVTLMDSTQDHYRATGIVREVARYYDAAVPGLEIDYQIGWNTERMRRVCPTRQDIIRICSVDQYRVGGGYQAVTHLGWQGNDPYLDEVQVKIAELAIMQYDDPYMIRIGMVCHELGHALGLDHNFRSTGCVNYTLSPYPDEEEVATLNWLYGGGASE